MALVLTRGLNESILIGGGEIRITVVRINGGTEKVRLAIEAPRDIDIVREELAVEQQQEGVSNVVAR